jgi:uncharacterized protein with ParB-like and HNH nuclease domain
MKFTDIPQLTKEGSYQINVLFNMIKGTLKQYKDGQEKSGYKFEMCPDFQRGHVWTEQQQVAFLEFLFRGGKSGLVIYFNHPGWQGNYKGDMVVVDGLQRLTAVLRFLNNEIKVFGHYYDEYEDKNMMNRINLIFNVNNLKSKAEVLKWYLEMNGSGTPHTEEELNRVRGLLEQEQQ